MQNELAKLTQTQRTALKAWFPSTLASLKVDRNADGSCAVEVVSTVGLHGYAFVGPRGGLQDCRKWS